MSPTFKIQHKRKLTQFTGKCGCLIYSVDPTKKESREKLFIFIKQCCDIIK